MSLETKKYQQALEYYSRLLGDGTYNNAAIVVLANTYYEMARDTADSRDFTTNKVLYHYKQNSQKPCHTLLFLCCFPVLQIRTHAIRKAHENIDKSLKSAEVILAQFDLSRQVSSL